MISCETCGCGLCGGGAHEARTSSEKMSSLLEIAERSYGLLWSETRGTSRTHQARRLLLSAIDKDGQRRGIDYALGNKPTKSPVGVTAVWLKNIGDDVIVEAEIDGQWVEIIRERADGAYSHIVEGGGITKAYLQGLFPTPAA